MKTTTLTAIAAILQADPPKSRADKETLTRAFGLNDTGAAAYQPADVMLTFEEAARRLGRKTKCIHALARRGVIRKAMMPGFSRASGVLASEIDRLLKNTVPEEKAVNA